jgi:poly [ADP-ribose] polymerase
MLDKTAAHYVNTLPAGYDSLRGLGTSYPDPKDTFITPKNVTVPYGKPIPNPAVPKSELLYNELIVYDIAQVRGDFWRFKTGNSLTICSSL